MWTITTSLAILAHISTIDRGVSHIVAAPLITAIRIFYSASLCWMIVASQTGHGGSFTRIMNSPVFVHLNKLSYAVYLLNPLLITVIYGYRDHSSHVDPITMVRITCYTIAITFLYANFVLLTIFHISSIIDNVCLTFFTYRVLWHSV